MKPIKNTRYVYFAGFLKFKNWSGRLGDFLCKGCDKLINNNSTKDKNKMILIRSFKRLGPSIQRSLYVQSCAMATKGPSENLKKTTKSDKWIVWRYGEHGIDGTGKYRSLADVPDMIR